MTEQTQVIARTSDRYIHKRWLNSTEALRLINERFQKMTLWQFYQRARIDFRTRKDEGSHRKYETRSIFQYYEEEYPPKGMELAEVEEATAPRQEATTPAA